MCESRLVREDPGGDPDVWGSDARTSRVSSACKDAPRNVLVLFVPLWEHVWFIWNVCFVFRITSHKLKRRGYLVTANKKAHCLPEGLAPLDRCDHYLFLLEEEGRCGRIWVQRRVDSRDEWIFQRNNISLFFSFFVSFFLSFTTTDIERIGMDHVKR